MSMDETNSDDAIIVGTNDAVGGPVKKLGELSPLNFDVIRQTIENDNLGFLDKRKLVKQEVIALCHRRKAELDAVMEVELLKIRSDVNVADKAVKAYENELILRIRQQFLETAGSLGIQVEMRQLRILTKFSEDLREFCIDLATKDIDERQKKMILDAHDRAWSNMFNKFSEMTAALVSKAAEANESS